MSEVAQLDRLDAIYESGHRAYRAGISGAKPPFVKGSAACRAWLGGWEDARHEHEDAPPED